MEIERGRRERMMRHGAYKWSYACGYPCIVFATAFCLLRVMSYSFCLIPLHSNSASILPQKWTIANLFGAIQLADRYSRRNSLAILIISSVQYVKPMCGISILLVLLYLSVRCRCKS